jgi:hypothetical protein
MVASGDVWDVVIEAAFLARTAEGSPAPAVRMVPGEATSLAVSPVLGETVVTILVDATEEDPPFELSLHPINATALATARPVTATRQKHALSRPFGICDPLVENDVSPAVRDRADVG